MVGIILISVYSLVVQWACAMIWIILNSMCSLVVKWACAVVGIILISMCSQVLSGGNLLLKGNLLPERGMSIPPAPELTEIFYIHGVKSATPKQFICINYLETVTFKPN